MTRAGFGFGGIASGLLGSCALMLSACAPAGPGDSEYDEVSLAASTPQLVVGKQVRVWTNLLRVCEPNIAGANVCVAMACPGQPFNYTFTFRNRGSVVWRDVTGRGTEVGNDVFLETANGKQNPLTKTLRYSIKRHTNDFVRWDRKAVNCITKRGCRRTRSVKGGIGAVAPKTPGLSTSRWRLRDYSAAWGGESKGFGPKVAFQLRTVDCGNEVCGCSVTCQSGDTHRVWWALSTDDACAAAGESFCGTGKTASHEFNDCQGPGGGVGDYITPPGEPPPEEPDDEDGDDDDDGWWYAPSDDEEAEEWSALEEEGIGTELPDDSDYEPTEFDGVDPEEAAPWNVAPLSEEGGCAVTGARRSGSLGIVWSALLGVVLFAARRRTLKPAEGSEAKGGEGRATARARRGADAKLS